MAVSVSLFRAKLQADVPECPIPRIDAEIVDAIRTFCVDTHVMKKTITAEVTPVDMTVFNMATLDLATHAFLIGYDPVMPVFFALETVPYGIWEMDPNIGDGAAAAAFPYTFPVYFGGAGGGSGYLDIEAYGMTPTSGLFFKLERNNFYTFPYPSTDETEIMVTLVVKPELTVTSVDDAFYYDHRDAVLYLARHQLHRIPRKPWTDLALAGMYRALYQEEVGKVRVGRRMGGFVNQATVSGGYF